MLIADELNAITESIPTNYPQDKFSAMLWLNTWHRAKIEMFTVWHQAHCPDATTVEDLPEGGKSFLSWIRTELDRNLTETLGTDWQRLTAKPKNRRRRAAPTTPVPVGGAVC